MYNLRKSSPVRTSVLFSLWMVLCLFSRTLAAEDRITLLLTHPTTGELRNILKLTERGLLDVSGLRLVGIYFVEEEESYEGARNFIETMAPEWMEIEGISCDLKPETLFQKNDCTPVFTRLFADSAGVIFTGGPDIPPSLYGEKTRLTTEIVDPPRHWFELSFLFHLLGSSRNPRFKPLLRLRPDYLVLGLCLGMQSMNVAAGGTLIQDIPSQVYGIGFFEDGLALPLAKIHRSYKSPLHPGDAVGNAAVHPIRFIGGSWLAKLLAPGGKPVKVVSLHHQAVKKKGKNLVTLATSLDGKIIEAIGHERFKGVLGVQFHPEKHLIWEPDRIYRPSGDAPDSNFVADWFAGDEQAQAFVRSFWRWVGVQLKKSAAAG